MGEKRRRFKQTESLETRLEKFARDMRRQAETSPGPAERKELLARASSADYAIGLARQLGS